ncbi:hypothetical protein BGX38DRAFT_1259181 [Terfezia claveryi]|nr:hypothetical protein BGX38DRAFT_1259181 [Terfezia claveryi]
MDVDIDLTEVEDSDSDPQGIQDVPIISYQGALEGLEALRFFPLQNPHVNSQRGEKVEAVLYREKRDIETLQGIAREAHHQTAVTSVSKPFRDISWFLSLDGLVRAAEELSYNQCGVLKDGLTESSIFITVDELQSVLVPHRRPHSTTTIPTYYRANEPRIVYPPAKRKEGFLLANDLQSDVDTVHRNTYNLKHDLRDQEEKMNEYNELLKRLFGGIRDSVEQVQTTYEKFQSSQMPAAGDLEGEENRKSQWEMFMQDVRTCILLIESSYKALKEAQKNVAKANTDLSWGLRVMKSIEGKPQPENPAGRHLAGSSRQVMGQAGNSILGTLDQQMLQKLNLSTPQTESNKDTVKTVTMDELNMFNAGVNAPTAEGLAGLGRQIEAEIGQGAGDTQKQNPTNKKVPKPSAKRHRARNSKKKEGAARDWIESIGEDDHNAGDEGN